ncbi:uncharacterized protein LOC119641849 [Glossina fuscipes]|uniref:Uncharacterized protein LOC119641849 n=1 Tax=Glossina fuscipes TaxID=7396 RepID=A0A9C5ZHJ3_9MUSC|nr:uncharacterized protein LOC119641849 [Glossina fuscipes]
MIELLSLPRRHTNQVENVAGVKFKSGLPINSLPGWEHIPLNSKLPMLKCPGNQVIFSKNKIGQAVRDDRHLKHEFDPSGRDSFPEYNPLHDSNLKTFYANERNLKRLRENGEITHNNDVICNLKDFNEYRQQLHKSQLYYILQDLNRLEAEQHDRMLIANAEFITNKDHRNLSARQHTYTEILQRKQLLDEQKIERCKKLLERTQEKFLYVSIVQNIRKATIEHKKALRQLRMQKHLDVRNDLQRKQLIALKKLFQFKKDRLQKNLRLLQESRDKKANEEQYASWNKRLAERIANQKKIQTLIAEVSEQRKIFIENHKRHYHEKWERIQNDIKKRSNLTRKHFLSRHKVSSKKKLSDLGHGKNDILSICNDLQGSFEKMLDEDVCLALNAVLDMEENVKVPFDSDDPIYKAAQFIMNHILAKFNKDLSHDKAVFTAVYDRLHSFFDEARKFVLFRATQIITSVREFNKSKIENNGYTSRVSFSRYSSTIGTSSYSIHPLIEIKAVSERRATPAGSLDSLVIDSTTSLVNKAQTPHLCRNEIVFIEHYLVKFKRELIVGVGRIVFAALQCHFQNKIMNVRQELLDIDRKFLLKQVTKSILSYSVNPLNFESNLRLCISALASDIIWSLQQQLLKPDRDPRRIAKPKFACNHDKDSMQLCMDCFGS